MSVHDQKPDVSPNTSIAIDYPITPIHESAAQHQDLTKVQSAEQKRQRLYKTELCRNWEKQNQCQYGDRCQYAHGVCDLRQVERHPKYKTQTCRTFEQTGACPYGIRCTFRHELSSPLTSVALDNLSAHPQTSLPPRRQWVFDSNTVDITLTSEAESLLPQKLLTDLANPPISPSADLWYPMNADLRCIPFF
ncbi:uncharacterized protein BYT42DRAFT_556368 [Radiomyces spectabilis]|uniref:uncharacterized protein n=1 Tax=Radiomyces spectabilis TaxID=64574 RepID=UPI00221FDA2A|nr:uncharacterized protein BYT42DRAFT_556368 [Radiomyces spectabilis]KAI8391294.1 hypothetical protein BYT42DRAFT_556368 [Radiomyces spectabilis]